MTSSLRILYVEDNPLVREVTAELLHQEARQITSCDSAEKALLEFNSSHYDLVITDVSLPLMSGLELVKNLLQARPQLPIIVASGYAVDSGIAQFGRSVRSIIKPFDGPDIDAVIAELVNSPQGA